MEAAFTSLTFYGVSSSYNEPHFTRKIVEIVLKINKQHLILVLPYIKKLLNITAVLVWTILVKPSYLILKCNRYHYYMRKCIFELFTFNIIQTYLTLTTTILTSYIFLFRIDLFYHKFKINVY
jgi:hypothetical protein